MLGVGISIISLASAREAVAAALAARAKGYICVTGMHGVTEAQSDPSFRRILNRAYLCTPDGMPMVWLRNNPLFVARVLLQKSGLRDYPLE